MKIEYENINNVCIAKLASETAMLTNAQEMLELIVNCGYQGAHGLVISEYNLTPDFFDLKTRIAGEMLQKVSQYNMRLAIIGDFTKYTSKSLQDFIYESNKVGRVIFVDSVEAAVSKLSINIK